MAQGKMKKDHLNPMINNFLVQYLKTSRDFLTINRQAAKITNAEIKDPIEKFMAENPNDYDFPNKFL
jgi:hypothetical protein